MTWMATTFWIVMLIAAVAAQRVLPNPTWYLIHVAGLGIIGTSILVWTWHFADALTRRKQSQKKQLARLGGLFAGTVALAVALAFLWCSLPTYAFATQPPGVQVVIGGAITQVQTVFGATIPPAISMLGVTPHLMGTAMAIAAIACVLPLLAVPRRLRV